MTAVEKARAFAASKALAGVSRPSASQADWQEWRDVAIELRKTMTRRDKWGHPKPMTWEEVIDYIHGEFPASRAFSRITIRSKLSTALKRHAQA